MPRSATIAFGPARSAETAMSVLATVVVNPDASAAEIYRILLLMGAVFAVLTAAAFWLLRRWR